jgi:hypothetical protein
MSMQVLASVAGAARVHRGDHDHHLAHSGDFEFEALTTSKSRAMYDLDLGQLVVVGAHTVDSPRTETVQAPEFTDRKFRGVSNGMKYIRIAPSPQNARGGDR